MVPCTAMATQSFVRESKVPVVDTTAAGDTFTGYFIGGLQLGEDPKTALEHAAKAAAIAVSRPGAAPSVPNREEVETFEG